MAQQRFSLQSARSLSLSLVVKGSTVIVCLVMSLGQISLILLNPIYGLIGIAAIMILLLFIQLDLALPLYILVAGPTTIFSVSSSGILSRLYIGNLLFVIIVGIWLLRKAVSKKKVEPLREGTGILVSLICLAFIGFLSIMYSHLFPDPVVTYAFVHSNAPLILVNFVEVSLLISLPLFIVVFPGMIRTLRDARWIIRAYLSIGLIYALGTIFAAPLHLYSPNVILGIHRPQVFGDSSSSLGMLNVLFCCLSLGQMFYSRKQATRLAFGLLVCIFATAAIMTFGREAWIGLLISIWVILCLHFKSPIAFILPLIILLFLLILFPEITNFFDPTKVYGADRINIWQDAIAIWQHSPYMGVGAGNYQFFDLTYGTEIVGVAHNQFLGVLADMGVQGLVCLLLVIIMIGRAALTHFKTAISDTGKAISLAYMGYYVALLFASFFTGPFVFSTSSGGGTASFVETSYLWIFLGLVLSIPNWDREASMLDLPVKISAPAELNKQYKGLIE